MNVIPARAVSANPTHERGLAMNLRKKSTREEFERALAQCKPEDFRGHAEFYRLTAAVVDLPWQKYVKHDSAFDRPGDPLHWGGPWLHHRRSDCDPRLGRPLFSRLVLAVDCPAARFHPAISPRFGTAVVDLEVWREIAAAAALSDQ